MLVINDQLFVYESKIPFPPRVLQRVVPPCRPLDRLRHLLRARPVLGQRQQVLETVASGAVTEVEEGGEAQPSAPPDGLRIRILFVIRVRFSSIKLLSRGVFLII